MLLFTKFYWCTVIHKKENDQGIKVRPQRSFSPILSEQKCIKEEYEIIGALENVWLALTLTSPKLSTVSLLWHTSTHLLSIIPTRPALASNNDCKSQQQFTFMMLFSLLGFTFSNYSDIGQRLGLHKNGVWSGDQVRKTPSIIHSIWGTVKWPHAHSLTRMAVVDSSQYLPLCRPGAQHGVGWTKTFRQKHMVCW